MITKFHFLLLIFVSNCTFAQTNNFKIEEKFTTLARAKKVSDSLKLPILVTNEYVFSIGEICYQRLLDGYINDRNNYGDINERENDGDINNRENGGGNNDRNKGGAVAERNKNGKKNNRYKAGDNNDRDKAGDNNDRDKAGDNNDRNSDGSIAEGPHCSNTKKGNVILYTRHEIKDKSAFIYFNNNTFNNKYFKINKL
jgi:hypothetical protein